MVAGGASDRSFRGQVVAGVFLAYFVAGQLGQATGTLGSGNVGPVWPAYGIALAAFLRYGVAIWPGIATSAFVVALFSRVPAAAAAAGGQAAGVTLGALAGAHALKRMQFDPELPRLRDVLAFIGIGAFGSAVISATVGVLSLVAAGAPPYFSVGSAWLINWLANATGALLVTPLVFTLSKLFTVRENQSDIQLATLLTLLLAVSLFVFGQAPPVSAPLDVLALAVLPLGTWAAVSFGVAGASFSSSLVATVATILTGLGLGPFAKGTPQVNAVLLDILFSMLAGSSLALAAVIREREQSEEKRAHTIREQAAMQSRLHLAAVMESSEATLSGKLIEAQEQERARIARELHDDIGQRLALLAVKLTVLAQHSSDPRTVYAGTVELQKEASQLALDVQTLSHGLHSAKLELLGVAAAMRLFCEEFAKGQSAIVDFTAHDVTTRVPAEVSLCLFRVLQEGLHNAARHSGARQFIVRLWGTPGRIHLVIRDSGTGFDVAAAVADVGFGLVSMKERVRLVGGEFLVDSRRGRGTTIYTSVPLD